MSDRMLLCIRDGVLDVDGEAHELSAGITRIAPGMLKRYPQYGAFFEPDFSVRAIGGSRSEVRTLTPEGQVPDHRFD